MADCNIPHFQNDLGYKTIEIGVKEFMCVGATQPFDHPHIFIDMGAADEKFVLIVQHFIAMFPHYHTIRQTQQGVYITQIIHYKAFSAFSM